MEMEVVFQVGKLFLSGGGEEQSKNYCRRKGRDCILRFRLKAKTGCFKHMQY